ncbi:hypothetical protein KIL84_023043 [Mauremys mutica]|uniref:Uncharacterized protein n=1 Tax=Mauremys mutica TaxID=74926 RepID=A0A9D3WPB7_9SAUR|nr:hypothetical protein KIL84_023043 [Mauremys mutica]
MKPTEKRRAVFQLIMENVNNAVLPDDLNDLLREFDEVIEDFDKGEVCQYEQHLEELKRRTLPSVYDSGIDELESTSTSPGSSLNSSEEDLNTSASIANSKAKLGDTQELEEFIADLDKVLEAPPLLARLESDFIREESKGTMQPAVLLSGILSPLLVGSFPQIVLLRFCGVRML